MGLFEELQELGVDVREGLERVMDDEPLYETMLGMFVNRINSDPIEMTDFAVDDAEDLIERVHILKGLTGNLAMTQLFKGYVQTLDLLRGGSVEAAGKEYERILPAQAAIADCIKRHMND